MDAPTYGSHVQIFEDYHYSMRLSNDVDRTDPVGLSSLGVVDLDLAIVPDVFGPRAFDSDKPITRMFPGHFPNELRVLIPDLGIAPEGFHDIVISDLSATPAWWTNRLSPGDVTSFRWCWPRILFRTMYNSPVNLRHYITKPTTNCNRRVFKGSVIRKVSRITY